MAEHPGDAAALPWFVPLMWVDQYVGIPHVDNGRSLRGWDCWGSVRQIILREKGIELPAFDTIDSRDVRSVGHEIRRQCQSPQWIRVLQGTEREFDVAVMWTLLKNRSDSWERMEVHVGLVVAPNLLLHVEPHTGTVCVPFNHASVRDRITRIYRHRALA